jgi:hypothetical protein
LAGALLHAGQFRIDRRLDGEIEGRPAATNGRAGSLS